MCFVRIRIEWLLKQALKRTPNYVLFARRWHNECRRVKSVGIVVFPLVRVVQMSKVFPISSHQMDSPSINSTKFASGICNLAAVRRPSRKPITNPLGQSSQVLSIAIHHVDFKIPVSRRRECNLWFVVRGENNSRAHRSAQQNDDKPCERQRHTIQLQRHDPS